MANIALTDLGLAVTPVARNEAKLREAVAQLPGAGHDFIATDLSQPEGIDLVARRLAARHD